jgi:hypothetical protein
MKYNVQVLSKIAEEENISLTHFLVETYQKNDSTEGIGRFAKNKIHYNSTVAIIGGLVEDNPNGMISMPIGSGLYLNQGHMLFRATINHSCTPNCKIEGFNKLVAIIDIPKDTELTIDYGSVSVGNGKIIIQDCNCNTDACRKNVKTDDYLIISENILAAYPKYVRKEKCLKKKT